MNDTTINHVNGYSNRPEYFKSNYSRNQVLNNTNQHQYHSPPKIDFNQRLHYEQQSNSRNC